MFNGLILTFLLKLALIFRNLNIPRDVSNTDYCRTWRSSPARSLGVRRARPPSARTPGHRIGSCHPPRHPEEPPCSALSPPSSSAPRMCAGAGLEQQHIVHLTFVWLRPVTIQQRRLPTLNLMSRGWRKHLNGTNITKFKTFHFCCLSAIRRRYCLSEVNTAIFTFHPTS